MILSCVRAALSPLMTVAIIASAISTGASAQQAAPAPVVKRKTTAEVMAWAEGHLELTGWRYLNHSAEVVRFISRPSAREGTDHAFAKMRVERFTKDAGRDEQSVISDVEIDCEANRTRILTSIGFANGNLRAPKVFERTRPDAWRDPTGTVMEGAVGLVCSPPDGTPSPSPGGQSKTAT